MAWRDAYYDGTHQGSDRAAQIYSDLDLFFTPKTGSDDVSKVIDVAAVKRSVRNLILTNEGEKPFHPEIGSSVRAVLFEQMTPVTAFALSLKVEDVILNFEPRAKLISVTSRPNLDRNAYEVSIEFYVINAPTELVTMDVLLERVR